MQIAESSSAVASSMAERRFGEQQRRGERLVIVCVRLVRSSALPASSGSVESQHAHTMSCNLVSIPFSPLLLQSGLRSSLFFHPARSAALERE